MHIQLPKEISFGQWLRQRRRLLDLTQQELADQVGCARITLRRLESGVLKPSKELAVLLLEKLGTPPDEQDRWLRFARGLSTFPEEPEHLFTKKTLTNLHTSLTSFIGRDKERDDVIQLLEKNRLVTLIGAGGIGKTRLSLQIGEKLLPSYADGIWVAALDSISDPTLIAHTIATVFGIRGDSDPDILTKLLDALRAKSMLLILDNCEHLLPACTQVIETLLKNCQDLKIMATSREILGAAGEAIYTVPPLSTPLAGQNNTQKRWMKYESIRLFQERAQLTLGSFAVSEDKALAAMDICRRLDGIPLAIELAAARLDILQLDEILDQLNHCFDLLIGNRRTALPRHQTMRASMDWSWGLLSELERTFMRELCVFAGGWTLDSAKAVCEGDVLNLTSSLVKKSLIVVLQKTGRETRYHLHEIVRQYVHEKLVQSGVEKDIRTRHLRYFLDLSEQAETALKGPAQFEWAIRLEAESDNFRAALRWAAKGNVEAGLYLSSRLHSFHVGLDLRESAERLVEFLQRADSNKFPRAKAKALYAYGEILNSTHQFSLARAAVEEGLALDRLHGNKYGEVDGLLVLALIMINLGDTETEKELSQQALKLARSLGDQWRKAEVLAFVGRAHHSYEQGRAYMHESINLVREIGDLNNLIRFLGHLGRIEMLNGDFESAQRRLEEAVSLMRQVNRKTISFSVWEAYGRMALLQGNYDQAQTCLQEAVEVADKTGERMALLWFSALLGYVTLKHGNAIDTRKLFAKCIREFWKDQVEIGVVFATEGMASLSIVAGRPEHAARLLGWVDRMRKKLLDTRPPLEQANINEVIEACLVSMGEIAFSNAYEEGQEMTIGEAVTLALQDS